MKNINKTAKRERIAVFTPRIYFQQIKYSLEELDYNVIDYSYGIIDKSSLLKRILTAKNELYAYAKQAVTFNKLIADVIKEVENKQVDIIFFFKGQEINNSLIKKLKDLKVPIIYWSTDSLCRVSNFNCHLIADINFLQDGGDCKKKNDTWLPLGIDVENFYQENNKKYDVTFIGRSKGSKYKIRKNYLHYLVNSKLPKYYNVKVISNFNPIIKKKLQYFNRNVSFLGSQPYNIFAKYIRESKIVINIHQDDGIMPINPLFFSIPFSKTIQIVDNRNYYQEWLSDNFFIQSKPQELIQKIKYCLDNYDILCNNITENYNELNKHTMIERFRYILEKVNMV